jgi:DNA polymerase elongation subunit (family B)
LDKYYCSIEELPVSNWWKLHEKNDFKQVLRDSKDELDDRVIELVKELQNEFISTFGIDENYAQYLRKQIQIELMKINVLKTGDRSLETMIDILEIELEDLTRKEEDRGLNSSTIAVEKWMGFKLDTKKISTFEYYSYIEAVK